MGLRRKDLRFKIDDLLNLLGRGCCTLCMTGRGINCLMRKVFGDRHEGVGVLECFAAIPHHRAEEKEICCRKWAPIGRDRRIREAIFTSKPNLPKCERGQQASRTFVGQSIACYAKQESSVLARYPRGAGGMKGDAATVTSGHTSTAGALTHKDLARKMPRWGV